MSQWNRKIKCVQNGWEIPLKKGRAEDSRQGPSARGNGRKKVCKKKTRCLSTRKTQNIYSYKWIEQ